ncbi:MAG: bacillithiol system redox-active protein YtxJ [Saprospiraceae bacterium]|nr:bacillithiol system redox-active protein YtxJ [Saprospiraceae bacterium]
MIAWQNLESVPQIDKLADQSYKYPVLIFKHSTRCNISAIAKMRLEDQWTFLTGDQSIYFLDILRFRDVSNAIAERFSVHHESPQLLVIDNGDCTYDASHFDIHLRDIQELL